MDRDARQKMIHELSGKHFSFTDKPVPGRANTLKEKTEILNRLAALWEQNPKMRLGQLIGNVYHSTDGGGCRQYNAEDYALIEEMEDHYDRDETA